MPCPCTNIRARITGEQFFDGRVMKAEFYCEDCRQPFRVTVATSPDYGVTTNLQIVPAEDEPPKYRLAS